MTGTISRLDSKELFKKYVPTPAIDYCYDLWQHHGFQLKITKSRSSKLGDYRYVHKERRHYITVNHDLNHYQFLMTYLHEVAHLITFEQYQSAVMPHGKEWKSIFKNLLIPMMRQGAFPKDLTPVIYKFLSKPKASSCADPDLFKALSKYDGEIQATFLSDIEIGQVFQLDKRIFQKEEKKRTRSVCLDINTGRKYLISEVARVKPRVKSAEGSNP
ncbi:MAG: SprT-like domain-containing protein [Cyclobacteriaceae bacterium]